MKIFILKNRAIGDSIIGLSSVQYLKSILPDAEIVYGVPSWVYPLYNEVSSDASRLIPISFKTAKDWIQMLFLIKREKFDLIIELNQSGRSKIFFNLFKSIFRFKYFFRNHNETVSIDKSLSNIQRDLRGVFSAMTSLKLTSDISEPEQSMFQPKLSIALKEKKQVIFGVVASRETKMWPLTYFADLAEKLLSTTDINILIPVSNSSVDQKVKNDLNALIDSPRVTFLNKPLSELPEKLGGSLLYIGNDTGLKHISVALGVPTITFFSTEQPIEWHPYNLNKNPYFFIEGLPCRTKTKEYCDLDICPTMICMKQISVDQTYQKAIEFLG